MRWTSLLAIYILFWAFSVFLVLPFGVRTTAEAGGEHVPGTAESAPHEFSLKKVVVRTTIVATMLFALFVANYEFGWVTAGMLDLADPANAVD
jgi:predicted secreted protein